MSSGTQIILDALKEIGAHSIANPAGGETISDVKRKLDSMLQMWLTDGIDLGVLPINLPAEELNEPMDARNAIVQNLAIEASPLFDNGVAIVSEALRSNARSNYLKIKDHYQIVTIPRKVVSSTLPMGAGNRRGGYSNTFFSEGSEIEN